MLCAGHPPAGKSADMLDSIHLENFKAHRDTTVPLGRLSVLVGPNGSGKTSVLQALWLQSELVGRPFNEVLTGDWSISDLMRRGAQGPVALASTGTWNGEAWSSRLELHGNSVAPMAANIAPTKFVWRHGGASRDWVLFSNNSLGDLEQINIGPALGRTLLYKLDAAKIATVAYSSAEVEQDGTNAAVALAQLKLGYEEVFERIESELRRLVPNVERVRIRQEEVKRERIGPVVGSKIFFDFHGAPGVPAHAASEGTLIILAILTVLHGPNPPSVLLLDDFDQSLHPLAQVELVRLIKGLLVDMPEVQIVATAHSPYILDEIDPSDVHGFALRDDGTVAVKRLSEHPEAGKMKGALTAGQLWSLDPERDWVLRENAA